MGRSQRQRFVLLGIFALMAMLQFAICGRQSVWVDEIFSLAMATGHSLEHAAAIADPARGDFVEGDHAIPAGDLQRYLKHEVPLESPIRVIRAVLLSDTSPPLYYLSLYGWTLVFGTSDVAIRSLSIFCSLACFPFVAGIARRTGGDKAVVPACILFAMSPLGLYFFTEARMYALFLLCLLATAWSSLVLRGDGACLSRCLWWIGSSAAGMLTHYFFLFPWLAIIAFLFLSPGKLKRWEIIGTVAIAGLVLFPWYFAAARHLGQWRVTAGWLELHQTGFSPGKTGLLQYERRSSLVAIVLFALIATVAAWRLRLRAFSGPRLLLWLWLIAACAAPTLIDIVRHTYFSNNPRYALGGLPAAYLLAAVAIASLRRGIRVGALVLIALAWTVPIVKIYREDARALEPFRRFAHTVTSGASSSDVILVHSIPSGILGIARYCDPATRIASWIQQLGTRRVPESLHTLASGRTRILYVKVHQLGEPAPEEEWLRSHATTFHERQLGLGLGVDFRPRDSETF